MRVPLDRVWAEISDLQTHPMWMKDAIAMEFATSQRTGIGTRMDVRTRIGPFRTNDVLEVIGWIEGERIDVAHDGLIKGKGSITAAGAGDATRVTWVEELVFPWWLGGRVGEVVALPILRAVWKGNLERLEAALNSL